MCDRSAAVTLMLRWRCGARCGRCGMRAVRGQCSGRCSGRCLATLRCRQRHGCRGSATNSLPRVARTCLFGLGAAVVRQNAGPRCAPAVESYTTMAEDRPSCPQHIRVRIPYPYILLGSRHRHRSRHTPTHCRASRRHIAPSRRLPSLPHCAATSWAIRPLSTRVGLKTPSRDITTEVNYPLIYGSQHWQFTNYTLPRLHTKKTNEPAQPVMTCP